MVRSAEISSGDVVMRMGTQQIRGDVRVACYLCYANRSNASERKYNTESCLFYAVPFVDFQALSR